MPKLSQKGTRLPASPIRKLVPFAEKANEADEMIASEGVDSEDDE